MILLRIIIFIFLFFLNFFNSVFAANTSTGYTHKVINRFSCQYFTYTSSDCDARQPDSPYTNGPHYRVTGSSGGFDYIEKSYLLLDSNSDRSCPTGLFVDSDSLGNYANCSQSCPANAEYPNPDNPNEMLQGCDENGNFSCSDGTTLLSSGMGVKACGVPMSNPNEPCDGNVISTDDGTFCTTSNQFPISGEIPEDCPTSQTFSLNVGQFTCGNENDRDNDGNPDVNQPYDPNNGDNGDNDDNDNDDDDDDGIEIIDMT